MIGWDGTRNFVAVAGATGLAFVWFLVKRDHETGVASSPSRHSQDRTLLGFAFVAFLLMPNVIMLMVGDGMPRPGWMWVGLFENYVLPRFG